MTMNAPYQPVRPQRPARPVRLPSLTSGIDVTAFILAFLIPLIGAIVGMVAIHDAHKQGRRASGLAIAGVVIGWVALVTIVVVVIVVAAHTASVNDQNAYNACVNNALNNGGNILNCMPAN